MTNTILFYSYDRDEPFEFLLGNGEVIQGWDQGMIGMCVGEVRQITVPPELGYGAKGAGITSLL